MSRMLSLLKRKGDVLINPSSASPLPSLPTLTTGVGIAGESTSTDGKINNSTILLVIVILAVIFFICGLTHLLVRFFSRRPSLYSLSSSSRYPDNSGSDALQRQLQQLFRLHDLGLDQAVIDALPVFHYKDIVGLKEPSDCAVCLSEFSDQDKLRLLPVCSHAFHLSCIDTWLLSNSTCPLCRSTLVCSGSPFETQLLGLDYFRELRNGFSSGVDGHSTDQKPTIMEEPAGERRVYSVRLGKFRCLKNGEEAIGEIEQMENDTGCSNLDARRCYSLDARTCYSMGSYQYLLGDLDLVVALPSDENTEVDGATKLEKWRGKIGNSSAEGEVEDKRISRRSKGESFSVSKIWQWPKKGKVPGYADSQMGVGGPVKVGLPLTDKVQAVERVI